MAEPDRIDLHPPERSWEETQRVMEEAAVIERMTQLYREGGRTHAEALQMALDAYHRSKIDDPTT